MIRRLFAFVLLSVLLGLGLGAAPLHAQNPDSVEAPTSAVESESDEKDAPYVPTPQQVVWKMLDLAEVTEDDVVYDLGSGDGRIVISAAKEYGARGVGIEIDPALVAKARAKAKQAGVDDLVEFRQKDLFNVSLAEATVVTLYLWPEINNKLRPKLKSELNPGDRVVSHSFDIDGWPADTTVSMGEESGLTGPKSVFLWTIPDDRGGE